MEPRKFASDRAANFLQRFPRSDLEGKGCEVLHRWCRWLSIFRPTWRGTARPKCERGGLPRPVILGNNAGAGGVIIADFVGCCGVVR